jgi:alpha-beta hydrolase superfamily lysophospholipase
MKISHTLSLSIYVLAAALVSRVSLAEGIKPVPGLPAPTYKLLQGSPGKPLILVFTTDAANSLSGTYTTVPQALHAGGYTVAAVDVTCHGTDVRAGEVEGLGCWRKRIDAGGADIFAPMVDTASRAITEIMAQRQANGDVVVVGVSRGAYAALRVAASDQRVSTAVLLAPVTDLGRLTEFKGGRPASGLYGLQRHAVKLSQKHIFMQIGNQDDRVGTAEALKFANQVLAAGKGKPVDLTVIMTPSKGHAVAEQEFAAKWVMGQSVAKPKPMVTP